MKLNLRKVFLVCILSVYSLITNGQAFSGTTGLIYMPTADMQKDKTFMFGGNYLNTNHLSTHFHSKEVNYTFNYYLNITFFPWLEIGYTCTIHKAEYGNNYFPQYVWGKYCNQDRQFSGRLRLWKEGWWKEWTPQIVVGVNDPTTGAGSDYTDMAVEGDGNGFLNRCYIAATKHFDWYGKWGVHAAYLYNRRISDKLNGPAFGFDYQFDLKGEELWQKAINGLNLMGEYDSKFVNVGASYSLWKDHINVVGEWRDCKYPSVGVYFKVHLK